MTDHCQQTGKQRRSVRAGLHGVRPAIQIGKAGLKAALVQAIDEALAAREIIKVRVGAACPLAPAEAASLLAQALAADVAGVAGRVVMLHRPAKPREDEPPSTRRPVRAARPGGRRRPSPRQQ